MSSVAPTPINELAEPKVIGPVTRGRLRRLGFSYLIVFSIGICLALFSGSANMQSFGLGLAFPGGGFLHYAAGSGTQVLLHVGFFLFSVVLFAFSFLLWFGTGNQAAPLIVWLGAALLAGAMSHGHVFGGAWLLVGAISISSFLIAFLIHRRNLAHKLQRRAQRAAYVGTWQSVATPADESLRPAVDELSQEDVMAMRFCLDRALQPVDEFNGFDFIDQFQPSAVRYQINNLSYVLSVANYVRLPAMHGYLHRAQKNLIEKKKQHRVWKYWALESLWGNFRREANPIARDNVMYSGWYGAQIGLFEAATGDKSYAEPGSLTLTHPNGEQYVHDFHTLVETLTDNQRSSGYCLFPCEPNWIYPLCNNQAALGIRLHDRLHGTAYWNAIQAEYRQRLEQEFIDVDGHLTLFRSTRTGLSIPGLSSSSEDATAAFWMHPLYPDLSNRFWEIARAELFDSDGSGLRLKPLKPWLDAGNYRFNTAFALGALSMAARELGDVEALKALFEEIHKLETSAEGGVLSYPGCSTWSHTFMLNARVGRTNGLSDLVNEGVPDIWLNGPKLSEVSYPDILPAKAVSDGQAFEAVLYPGAQGGKFALGFSGFAPNQTFNCQGCVEASQRSDENGSLTVNVELDGRHQIRILP